MLTLKSMLVGVPKSLVI